MQKHLPRLVPALILAAFLALAAGRISYPGLHYDELLFANGALGDLDGTFVHRKLWGLPLYLVTYVGALNSWLYWPIFKLFGVTIWSVRLPMILAGAAGLLGFYFLAARRFGLRAAWMASNLLLLNVTFIGTTRQGYTGTEFLLQVAGLLALLGNAPVAVVALTFVIGVFYKVSFAWWLLAVCIGAFAAFPEKRRTVLIAGATVFGYLFLWRWLVDFPAGNELAFNLGQRWSFLTYMGTALITGRAYFSLLFLELPRLWLTSEICGAALLLGTIYGLYRYRGDRYFLFFAVTFWTGALIILLSARAISYWHLLPLLPFFVLLASVLMARAKWLGWLLWAAYALQLASLQIEYFDRSRWDPKNPAWSTAIYSLISWCRQDAHQCVSVEWGTHTQLLAFVGDASRVFNYSETSELNPDAYYITFFRYPPWPTKLSFLERAEKAGWDANVEKEISAGGQPVYSLYRLKRTGARPPAPRKSPGQT